MAYLKGQNNKLIVSDLYNDAILTNAIAPFTSKIRGKGFAELPGISAAIDTLGQPSQDYPTMPRIGFAQLLEGLVRYPDTPCHRMPNSSMTSFRL